MVIVIAIASYEKHDSNKSYLGHSQTLELRLAQGAELRAGREEVVF
jgi:hypothetical protein